ncbi:MAG: hypothetical protein ACRDY3_12120 [Acidimicrobiales bacterium]
MPTRSDILAEIPLFSLLDDDERAALAGRNLVGERIRLSGTTPRYRLDP